VQPCGAVAEAEGVAGGCVTRRRTHTASRHMDVPFAPLGDGSTAAFGGLQAYHELEFLEGGALHTYDGVGCLDEHAPRLPLPKRLRAEATAAAEEVALAGEVRRADGEAAAATTPVDATRVWVAGSLPFAHALRLIRDTSITCSGPRPEHMAAGDGGGGGDPTSMVGTIYKESPALRRQVGSDTWTSKGGWRGSKQVTIGEWKVKRLYGRVKLRCAAAAAGLPHDRELRYHQYMAEPVAGGGDGAPAGRLFHIVGLDGSARAVAHPRMILPSRVQTGTLRLRHCADTEAWIEFQAKNGAVVGEISAVVSSGSGGPRMISGNGDFAEYIHHPLHTPSWCLSDSPESLCVDCDCTIRS
jgi:hypothetical protein